MKVNAAAISLQGRKFMVILVDMSLVESAGEADMALDTLQDSFGGVQVVLMAQREDGSPNYYGEEALVRSLADLPVDKMPWKVYTAR